MAKMVVMTLKKVPPSLHGELSRWMIEVQQGVYVGYFGEAIRQRLWDKVVQKSSGFGYCTQIYQSKHEQGFEILTHGNQDYNKITLDGYQLIANKDARYAELAEKFLTP